MNVAFRNDVFKNVVFWESERPDKGGLGLNEKN
jgi:hypothetical protein